MIKLGIVYKNFAAWQGISHIGLGVAGFQTVKYLEHQGIQAKLIPVRHNVDLVEALRKEDFTHIVISAPWLSSFDLNNIVDHFKHIQFVIVSHSNIGFLQADPDGIARFRQYAELSKEKSNLMVGGNSARFTNWFKEAYEVPTVLLPNLYELSSVVPPFKQLSDPIKIGVFGAIRPQKNVLTAAAAAMLVQKHFNRSVEFNVSTGREDGGGNIILNAVRQMCGHVPRFHLVERFWTDWQSFRRIVREMDIMLQVSYTESFNVVTADGVSEGVPSVVSSAIDWAPETWKADVDNALDVASKAITMLNTREEAAREGYKHLNLHNEFGFYHWQKFLES